jgi:hypothetical protein
MGKMPNTKQAKQEKDYRPSVKIMMALAALLAIGLLFEAGARAVYVYRDGNKACPSTPISGRPTRGVIIGCCARATRPLR